MGTNCPSEILVFDRALTTRERVRVDRYFKRRYLAARPLRVIRRSLMWRLRYLAGRTAWVIKVRLTN